ncbi:MAG TPA: GNAT family N-acetyltransferase [Acidimicrobiales bacterium]|nr:GNAT family N-acetyltransferase [Acidimicrobiales bacterium]
MEVRHHPEGSRYELLVDGRVTGAADYRDTGAALVFHHTEVDPDRRGRGLGRALVQGALDDVRRQGRTIVPRCPFVAHFVEAHPEYSDLVSS